jgi:hypothetical protein
MGTPVVTVGSTVLCAHGGKVTMVPAPRVKANGQPVVLQPLPSTVAGCSNPPPPANVGPCVTVNWLTGSLRVKVNGQPILLQSSASVAVPPGTPASVVVPEVRVKAT